MGRWDPWRGCHRCSDGMEAVIVGGTHFIKDGKEYTLQVKDLCRQARLANIDFDT